MVYLPLKETFEEWQQLSWEEQNERLRKNRDEFHEWAEQFLEQLDKSEKYRRKHPNPTKFCDYQQSYVD